MTTYSIPNRPAGSATRSIGAILANFDAVLAALNAFDGGNITNNSITADKLTDSVKLGLSGASAVRRGKSIISGSESNSGGGSFFMPTPDRVQNVVLSTDGLIFVAYYGMWAVNSGQSANALITLNGNQLFTVGSTGNAILQYASLSGTTGQQAVLQTASPIAGGVGAGGAIGFGGGLVSTGTSVLGALPTSGYAAVQAVPIFANSGTYEVGIKYQSASTVFVSNRKLWVWTMGF